MDTDPIDLLLKRADRAILEFLPTKDVRYVREALDAIDELSRIHVYFELVRLEWRWRFAELRFNGYEERSEWRATIIGTKKYAVLESLPSHSNLSASL